MPFKMCSKVLRKHENPYKKCVLLGTKTFFKKKEIPDFAFKIVVFYSLQHTIFTFLKKNMSFLANCLVRSCQSVEKAVSGAQYFGPELKSHLHYLRVGSLGTFHIMDCGACLIIIFDSKLNPMFIRSEND